MFFMYEAKVECKAKQIKRIERKLDIEIAVIEPGFEVWKLSPLFPLDSHNLRPIMWLLISNVKHLIFYSSSFQQLVYTWTHMNVQMISHSLNNPPAFFRWPTQPQEAEKHISCGIRRNNEVKGRTEKTFIYGHLWSFAFVQFDL